MSRITLLVFLMAALISCNTTDGGRSFKSDVNIFKNPYITGKITNIGWRHNGQDSLLTILVEENPAVDVKGGKKIRFSLWEETEIFIRKKDKNMYHAGKEDLKVDQKVRGWLRSGIILDSYPAKAGAKRILVIDQ